MWQLLLFAGALVFFHASEFLLAATFMRDELSTKCKRVACVWCALPW
jgi:hypothetical protein